jgi:hypothetical protein
MVLGIEAVLVALEKVRDRFPGGTLAVGAAEVVDAVELRLGFLNALDVAGVIDLLHLALAQTAVHLAEFFDAVGQAVEVSVVRR